MTATRPESHPARSQGPASLPRRDVVRGTGVLAWITVYIVLLFGIPSRLVFHPLGSAGAPSTLFGLASALVWLLAELWRSASVTGPRRPIRVALSIFLVAVGISYVVAMTRPLDPDELSPADVGVLVVLSWSGAMLVAHDGLTKLHDLEVLVRRFALVGGIMAAVGLAQFVTKQPLVDRIAIPGLTASTGVDAFFRNGQVRISGTATHPIEFGALLSILLPIALHTALHPKGASLIRRWFPVATISLALALSMSRSAYIGLAISLIVLLIGWPPVLRWRVGGSFLVVGVMLCATVPRLFSSVRGMFANAKDDPSITSRTDSYAVALQFIEHAPWFGRGLGTFLPKYRIFDNNYLGLLVSVGIVGTIAFIAIPLTAIAVLLHRRRRWSDESARDLALSLVAGIIAGSVSLAFFDGFGFPMTMGTLFLTLGIAGALIRLRPSDRDPHGKPRVAVRQPRPAAVTVDPGVIEFREPTGELGVADPVHVPPAPR
ncbi:O-antigen ligase family protein [Cellulomonas sp. McL0617]|uniref:O-antigen ligase family protein n=1 Tax=Cellulomonas sp. McL0617 TaxID=3415675 RepID=UPI003CEB769F